MRIRLMTSLAVLGCLLSPALSRAADPDSGPTLIVRIRSIDDLMGDAKYLLTVVGQEEVAKQFDSFLKSMAGDKGLEGIDTKRPMGFYGTIGPNGVDSTGVLLVPIADQKAFLSLLKRQGLNVEQGNGGVYSFTPPNSPTDAFFRFANKYAYVTAGTKGAIDKDKLLDPATVLPAELKSALAATIYIDRIPDSIKQLVIGQTDLKLADEADKKVEGESEAERKFRLAMVKNFGARLRSMWRDGKTLSLKLDLDRKTNNLVVDASLSAKPNTKLATDITGLGQNTSLFAAVVGNDSALNFLLHGSLPADLQKLLGPLVDEAIAKALKQETDETKRAQAQKFLAALEPSLKAGELDFGFSLRGPNGDGKYAGIVGIKVKDGDKLDKALGEIVKTLKEEEQAKIEWDSAKIGKVSVHKFKVEKDLDEKARTILGENPIYMALRSDAWIFTFGEDGLKLMKEALSAKPKESAAVQFDVSLKRFASVMEGDQKGAAKAAEAAFAKPGSDKVRFAVTGGEKLQVRFTVKASVLKFLAEMDRLKKAKEAE